MDEVRKPPKEKNLPLLRSVVRPQKLEEKKLGGLDGPQCDFLKWSSNKRSRIGPLGGPAKAFLRSHFPSIPPGIIRFCVETGRHAPRRI